jgi:multicomponent Na+:H+ antiporter subunit D
MITILLIGLPALMGLILLIAKPKKPQGGIMATLAVTLIIAISLWQKSTGSMTLVQFTELLSFTFAHDTISSLFLTLVQLVFIPAVLFSFEYHDHDQKAYRVYGFTLLTLAALNGLCLSHNLLTFYLFYELVTLASFPLVLHTGTASARRAAIVYLGYSVAGAALVLSGFLLGGSDLLANFSAGGITVSQKLITSYAWLLIVMGFSCKAGMFPLQSWLPIAHPEAPAPASALLSGIITKAGILGILRTTYYLVGPDLLIGTRARNVMLTLSLMTIFLGSMLAFKEKLLKRRLAFSSVSQLSYVIFGMMMMTPTALEGAVLQVWFHAGAKITLFLVSGAIIHYTHQTQVLDLKGIGKRFPLVMGCFTIASLSLIGIPPLGGFIAKWQLAAGALQPSTGLFGWLGVIVLLISALLTAGYLLPMIAEGFFPGQDYVTPVGPTPGWKMHLPLMSLAAFLLIAGLFPVFLMQPLQGLSALLF